MYPSFRNLKTYIFIQSPCIEVAQWDIFMEKKMRFGLVLGQLAIIKEKFGPFMNNFWGQFFHVFIWPKNLIFFKTKLRTKNLHKMKVRKPPKNSINCALLYCRCLPVRLLYNDFVVILFMKKTDLIQSSCFYEARSNILNFMPRRSAWMKVM